MSKNKFYSFVRGVAYLPIKLLFPVKVIGKENLPLPEKIITVSNHLGLSDICIIAIYISGYRRMVGKKEIAKNGFIKWLVEKMGVITVDRGKADLTAIKKILGALRKGEGITIFPEGTRNKEGGEMQEVKGGTAMFALKGGSEIVPVMIHHKQKFFRKNYIFVGKPFSVAEYGLGKIDADAIEQAAQKIEKKMRSAQEYLNDYVEKKRWKEEKLIKKAQKKLLKSFKKDANRAKSALNKKLKSL